MTPFSLLYGRGGQNQRKPCANLLRKLSRRDDEWYVVSASGTVVPDNTADSPARCDKRSQTSTKIHVGKGESQRSELEMDWPRARRTCFNLIAPIWRCRFRKLDTCASMVKAAKNRMRQMSPDRSIGRVLGASFLSSRLILMTTLAAIGGRRALLVHENPRHVPGPTGRMLSIKRPAWAISPRPPVSAPRQSDYVAFLSWLSAGR